MTNEMYNEAAKNLASGDPKSFIDGLNKLAPFWALLSGANQDISSTPFMQKMGSHQNLKNSSNIAPAA